jgi:hypothetical protein
VNPRESALLVALAQAIIERGHDSRCALTPFVGEGGPWRRGEKCDCGLREVEMAFYTLYSKVEDGMQSP